MSALDRLAVELGLDREDILDSMRSVMNPDVGVVSLSVRAPTPGGAGYGVREGSALWKVANDLEIEPERLRDAVVKALGLAPGKAGKIGCRPLR